MQIANCKLQATSIIMFPALSISSAAVIAAILATTVAASSTAITNNNASTGGSSSTNEIVFELLPLIRVYRDGRVERLSGNEILPASFDPKTRVVSKDVVIDSSAGITARLYLPTTSFPIEALSADLTPPLYAKLPLLVYFHGGAFLVDSAFSPSYHPHLNNLASLAPLIGVSINYRLAPENPLPIAYQDSWTALVWVFSKLDPWLAELADFDRVYVAGDSAGANIAHQMALRGAIKFKGMALVHSYFWGKEPIAGERNDPKFRSNMEEIWRFLYPGTIGLDDPRINPVADASPSLLGLGCDRVLVAVAEKDILWSRGRLYYEKLKSSGWQGEAILVDTPDAEHDFHIFYPETDKAFNLTKTLAAFFGQDQVKLINM